MRSISRFISITMKLHKKILEISYNKEAWDILSQDLSITWKLQLRFINNLKSKLLYKIYFESRRTDICSYSRNSF